MKRTDQEELKNASIAPIGNHVDVAVVGSGPAGLMACSLLLKRGKSVLLIENRPSMGRKLLIAGSSGLNLSHSMEFVEFAEQYRDGRGQSCPGDRAHGRAKWWSDCLSYFGPLQWVKFVENLGHETFVGTSGRYFVREMKAAQFLKTWLKHLNSHKGFRVLSSTELVDFSEVSAAGPLETLGNVKIVVQSLGQGAGQNASHHASEVPKTIQAGHLILALGGGSWLEEPPIWPKLLQSKGIEVVPWLATNVGFEVAWNPKFLAEIGGRGPLKRLRLTTSMGSRIGELMVTSYGIEGTPIYAVGTEGPAQLDLRPDLSESQWLSKLTKGSENLSPMRRLKKYGGLDENALALVFHHAPSMAKQELSALVRWCKNAEFELIARQPLTEAISSAGGVSWSELDDGLRLKKMPHVSCIGEMLDWWAPTGGFLIQGCVSQAAWAVRGLLN